MTSVGRRGEAGAGAPARPSPWWAGWRLSAVLLIAAIAGGTAGYVIIEGWPVFDALYMTVTTMTTVGYMEVHPLSHAGRIFNIGVVIFGVATGTLHVHLLHGAARRR